MAKPAAKKRKAPRGGSSLAEILASITEEPEVFAAWVAGRPGRRPKFLWSHIEREFNLAMWVETERANRGVTGKRTPKEIYADAARKFRRIKPRTARYYHALHRDLASKLVRLPGLMEKRRRQIVDLVVRYGPEIARLPLREIARLHRMVEGASPSEIVQIERAISILCQKGKKPGL